MPRVAIKKKDYKVLDLKGWIQGQMKIHGISEAVRRCTWNFTAESFRHVKCSREIGRQDS